jgi:hypothetical protein
MIEDSEVDEERIRIARSDGGRIEVLYRRSDGKTIIISDDNIDMSNLPARARDLIERKELSKTFLLLGFGLGRYPEELLKMLGEKGTLIVYEAVPEFFEAILKVRDFTNLFNDNRLKLLLGEDASNSNFVTLFHRDIAGHRFYTLNQKTSIAMKEIAYKSFRNKVVEEKRIADQRVATAVHRGAEWGDSFLANIPTIVKTQGVEKLKDLFKGRPAIVVSAGPSLEKNIHLLREAKGKAIIIAVDVVLPTLVPAGIIPDLVITLEANPTQYLVFEDIPSLRTIPAVFASEVTHEKLTSLYPGPMYFTVFPNHPVHAWLKKYYPSKGFIEQFGGSVSHVSLGLAQLLGADPIALIGQDLSFKEKVHAGDVTDLFYPSEYLERNKKRNPIVKDIFGEDHFTLGQFLAFKTSFEKWIASTKTRVFQATEGGVAIEGTEIIRLRDFIDEFCNQSQIDTLNKLEAIAESAAEPDVKGMIFQIQQDTFKLKEIRRYSQKIVDCVVRLSDLQKRNLLQNTEAVNLVSTIEKFEKKVEDPILALIAPYRYSMRNYVRPGEGDDETVDMLQDSLEYYGKIISAIDYFIAKTDTVTRSLNVMSGIDSLMCDSSVDSVEKYCDAGMKYAEAGMVREAVKSLERAAGEYASISDPRVAQKYWSLIINVYFTLGKLYLKQHRSYEAKEILATLLGFVAHDVVVGENVINHRTISELMRNCDERIEKWEKKKRKMEPILRKAEVHYGSFLESGYFYNKVGNYKRSITAFTRAIGDDLGVLKKPCENSIIVLSTHVRILGAYYGLAQTYIMLNREEDALNALESASQIIEGFDSQGLEDTLLEFCVPIIDLYSILGVSDKAILICQNLLAKVPRTSILKDKMEELIHARTPNKCEAHG